MQEVVRINLDNEMDLILAHKRTMKLAELCGLSVPSQTTFATAVSEIARTAISYGKGSFLVLSIHVVRINKKEIVASLFDHVDLSKANSESFAYARRLMGDLHMVQKNDLYEVRLCHYINFSGTISSAKIESFKEYFKSEPPLSPYDEIRKKNIQLIELAEKFKESEAQYRMLSDTLPLMMFGMNQREEVTFSNKWLKEFFEAQGGSSNIFWHSALHPDDFRAMSQDWNKSMLSKTSFKAQGRLKYKDKFIWHLISIVPVKNEKDAFISWIGFFVDINAQKQIEETLKDNKELKEMQLELVKRNSELEQFAHIASHDLQEPLRKIRTFSSLLEEKLVLDEENRNYFNKIIVSSDRMSRLIKDVLNFSEVSNNKEQFTETDLNLILEGVKTDFELLIGEKNATIRSNSLPVVKGIPLQLSQLFSNLISNSLKFSKQAPLIDVTCEKIVAPNAPDFPDLDASMDHYMLSFQDNGIGFEQQFAEQIFTIFQRLHSKQTYSGTGIGLALCKKIVENHQGVIKAFGEPGKGVIFKICLPIL